MKSQKIQSPKNVQKSQKKVKCSSWFDCPHCKLEELFLSLSEPQQHQFLEDVL